MTATGIIHRRPTVLFCDLVDSSRLAERLDGEQFWDVVVSYQDVCNQVVSRFDGYIYKSLGDGLIVLFGVPLAHEDDARRAVYTGLGIVEAIHALNPVLRQKYGVTLSVRVGIHTGEVVVGEMRGITEIAGSTPAQASRIQALAAPDSTLISRDTANLVAGYFEFETRGEVELRGMSRPVELLEVMRPTAAESRLEAQGGLTPLVGRQAELHQMQDLWKQVCAGAGKVLLIQGEAGIGKSRLARHLRDLSARIGGSPLEGSCSPYHTSTAFHPLARMLNRRIGLTVDSDDSQRLKSLEQEIDQAGMERTASVPYLAPLLSIELDPAGPYPLPRVDAVRLRQTTIEVFISWWSKLAQAEPRLVLIEDLHWAEPSTLEVIERIIAEPPPHLLLVTTARPEFAGWDDPHVTTIELRPLSHSDRHLMIRSIGSGDLAEPVVEQIADRSDGVPLFVEELLRTLGDAPPGTPPAAIPATLHDMLIARLEAAGPDLGVAQAAAVIDTRIDVDLLKDVTHLDEGRLR
ncbi:MAG: ATP-binding protein, partial [Acidimicrobiia bacterium]